LCITLARNRTENDVSDAVVQPTPLPHPTLRVMPAPPSWGALLVDTASGTVATGDAPIVSDVRGGFYCDDPGLGKTITALALILKTAGSLPLPPDGADTHEGCVEVDRDRGVACEVTGRFYYTTCDAAAPPSATTARRASQRSVTRQRTAHSDPEHFNFNSSQETSLPSLEAPDQPGASSEAEQIPLSSATLVVVPPTLTEHWLSQIRAHVAAGALRWKTVLTAGDAAKLDARELAWDYDVVITTFQLLSNQTASECGLLVPLCPTLCIAWLQSSTSPCVTATDAARGSRQAS
jgi:SNF2-related domain